FAIENDHADVWHGPPPGRRPRFQRSKLAKDSLLALARREGAPVSLARPAAVVVPAVSFRRRSFSVSRPSLETCPPVGDHRPGNYGGRSINPGIPIPAAASAVHGIRDRDVARKRPFQVIAERLNGCSSTLTSWLSG